MYAAPTITSAGLVVPVYADILADLISSFQSIYGSTIYLGQDSADYQAISAFSLKVADVMAAVALAYNARSPLTAVGSDLDGIVKLNGLVRQGATNSTCPVVLTGTPDAVITNGSCTDQAGNTWALPTTVTIGSGGTATATATCSIPGPIAAQPGTITTMATPTAGWTSVTNTVAATLGQNYEADSALRARQGLSVALPGMTMLDSTIAAIAATTGVTRYNVLENPTGSTDAYGNPPHSITCVVEGGAPADVAQAIYSKRGIGCFTNGTTTVQVTDPVNGTTMPISYDLPSYVPVYVAMSVHGLNGFTSSSLTSIQNATAGYGASLQIGESVIVSSIYGAAWSVMPNPALPQFSIKSVQIGAQAAATTATVSATSISITVTSAAGIAAGQVAVGAGIPAGTTVSSVNGTTVNLSAEATVSGSGVAVSFFALGTSDLTLNFNQCAEIAAANVVITQV